MDQNKVDAECEELDEETDGEEQADYRGLIFAAVFALCAFSAMDRANEGDHAGTLLLGLFALGFGVLLTRAGR